MGKNLIFLIIFLFSCSFIVSADLTTDNLMSVVNPQTGNADVIRSLNQSGNNMIFENITATNVTTDNLLVKNPPVRCPTGTYMVYSNMTTAICVSAMRIDGENVTGFYNFSDNMAVNDTLYIYDGRVGIGTASPGGMLDIVGSDFPVFQVTRQRPTSTGSISSTFRLITETAGNMVDGFGGGIVFSFADDTQSATNAARIVGIRDGGDALGALRFDTGGLIEAVRITSTGNVGIGTTNPNYKLDVMGDVNASNYYINGSSIFEILDNDTILRTDNMSDIRETAWDFANNDTFVLDNDTIIRSNFNGTLGAYYLHPNGTNPISLNHLVNKEFVELAVAGLTLDYFFTNVTSDIAGYYVLNNTQRSAPQSIVESVSLSSGNNQSVFNFSTTAGLPFIFLSEGIYDAHIHLDKTGGAAQIIHPRWELHKRNSSGDFLITISETSNVEITGTNQIFDLHAVFNDDVPIVSTDRLVLKLFVDITGGGSSTVRLYMEGTTDSHFTFRTPSSVLQEIFIRRDGTNELTGNWNVGGFDIVNIGNISADTLLGKWNGSVKYSLETDAMKYENITTKWTNIDLNIGDDLNSNNFSSSDNISVSVIGGKIVSQFNMTCLKITGSQELCDGDDATGAGASNCSVTNSCANIVYGNNDTALNQGNVTDNDQIANSAGYITTDTDTLTSTAQHVTNITDYTGGRNITEITGDENITATRSGNTYTLHFVTSILLTYFKTIFERTTTSWNLVNNDTSATLTQLSSNITRGDLITPDNGTWAGEYGNVTDNNQIDNSAGYLTSETDPTAIKNGTYANLINLSITNTNTTFGTLSIIQYNSSCSGIRTGTTGGGLFSCT